jgi:hypothetical protein
MYRSVCIALSYNDMKFVLASRTLCTSWVCSLLSLVYTYVAKCNSPYSWPYHNLIRRKIPFNCLTLRWVDEFSLNLFEQLSLLSIWTLLNQVLSVRPIKMRIGSFNTSNQTSIVYLLCVRVKMCCSTACVINVVSCNELNSGTCPYVDDGFCNVQSLGVSVVCVACTWIH